MGYSHGRKWTNKQVIDGIKDVMLQLDLERMPSRSEIELVMGNSSLSNKISKSGGFYTWAEKLGLDKKKSETLKSLEYEHLCSDFLSQFGDSVVTPFKFPYDILYEKCCKIDVKVSKAVYLRGSKAFSFNLEYVYPKCDFYVFYCVDDEKTRRLVVPAYVMTGKKQFCIGMKSKYDTYEEDWEQIFDYVSFIQDEFPPRNF